MLIGLGAAAFGWAAPTLRHAKTSEFGLLAMASPLFVVSIALTAGAFAISVRQHKSLAGSASIALMIAVQRLPSYFATDSPMYSWTYKHLGVVDYIQHEHVLAHGVDVYNSWPGAFAMFAWLSDLSGIPSQDLAHGFTPLFHVALVSLVFVAARAWGLDATQAQTAAFLTASLNWVAQDYYSPQATAMLLTAGILTLIGLSRTRPMSVIPMIVIFSAVTITHQLTPFWLLLVTGLLLLARQMKPWWIVPILAAIVIGYTLYNFKDVDQYTLFSLNVFDNAKSNVPTMGGAGQRTMSAAIRTLSGAMWVLTVLVLLVRLRRKQPFFALAAISLSPMLILGGQNYGGEAIFRVFLYSVVGCSIVLAPALVGLLRSNRMRFGVASAVLVLASLLSAEGYFGGWFANIAPLEQVESSKLLMAVADFPAYVTPIGPSFPQRGTWQYVEFARFDEHFDDPVLQAPNMIGKHFDTDRDYQEFSEVIGSRKAPTYLIFTEQMRFYASYYGLLPLDALPNLEARVRQDASWQLVYDDRGAIVFEHNPDRR
ncbi:hypothetical protein [Mycolicibacterium hodleri]|uniref:hypothetical protein n=1 Tax=Mycolicibacterium hodleri TaxID=49897 RepID=UPI0011282D03|nr:hypothetical protein [Mycolicibacterium hodleri]